MKNGSIRCQIFVFRGVNGFKPRNVGNDQNTVICIAQKRLKDVATRCVLTFESRKCVKMRLRSGLPLGKLTAPLRPPSWIWGKEWGKEGKGKEGRKREGEGRGGQPSLTIILATALFAIVVGVCILALNK